MQPPAALVLATSASAATCHGEANGSATVAASGGTPGYTYNWLPTGGTAPTATNLYAGTYTVTVTDANGCQETATAIVSQPTGMTLTTSHMDASCGLSNGQAAVTVSGVTPPYSYSWNTSPVQTTATATGIPAGSYVVIVTDATGCMIDTTIAVNNISGPSLAISTTADVSCNGGTNGSAAVIATGGLAPYTYSWAPSGGTASTASGLSAGIYTVTVVDANACITMASTVVTEPTPFTLTITATNVSCKGQNNGTATVNASGATPGYSYLWSPGGSTTNSAVGLTAGGYTVAVTDSKGCIAAATVNVLEPLVLSSSIAVNNQVSCNGGNNGSATVTASGGNSEYLYDWSPTGGTSTTAIGLVAGTYTATVTDAKGCLSTSTVSITEPAAIAINFVTTDVSCNGGNNGTITANAINGIAPYTYFWSPLGVSGSSVSGLTSGTYTVNVTDAFSCQGNGVVSITQPASLSATIVSVNVTCNGGSDGAATVSVLGGTAPYSYSWSTLPVQTTANVSGLTAGTYSVTVTDALGCIQVATVTITQPSSISISTAQTNVNCFGGTTGSATAVVSGGVAPYTYLWSPGGSTGTTASALGANTYTLTVTDAAGCTGTTTVTITQPPVLAVTSSVLPVSCNGGSDGAATVISSGGTGPYTYSWSTLPVQTNTTASGLKAGTYTVTVTDAKGCSITSTAIITEPAALSSSISASSHVSCNGGNNGNATVSVTGGTAPYMYFWSPRGGTNASATNLSADTYSVSVTDSRGCMSISTVTIAQPAQLSGTITTSTITCFGGNNGSASVTSSGGTSPYTYVWNTVPAQTAATATNLTAGSYSVMITDNQGCSALIGTTVAQSPKLFITSSQTNVSCTGGSNGTAAVSVSGGIPGYTYNWAPSGGTLATASGLSSGTYTVTVTDAGGCTGTITISITQPAVLQLAATLNQNVSCFGGTDGSATVTASGGTAGYTYHWLPGGGTLARQDTLSAGTYTITVTDAKGCSTTTSIAVQQPSVLASAISFSTPVSCMNGSDGTATVGVTGGTAPYTYMWLPIGGLNATATGLTAGTYTVTAADAKGCTTSTTVAITQPTQLTGLVTTSAATCFGGNNGSATAFPTGGTSPYTYAWSTTPAQSGITATNLQAGNYSVTITDNKGCTTTIGATVAEATALSISASKTDVFCAGGNNGTATAIATGGTPGYSYNWIPTGGTASTASGLTAGNYTVIVTDAAGCAGSASLSIAQPVALVTSVTVTKNVSCFNGADGAATVTASGGTPGYTYNWLPSGGGSPAANTLIAGTYTVTITDSKGCTAIHTQSITQPSVLALSISPVNVSCNGGADGSATVTASGGTPPYTYSWSLSGGTSSTATGLTAGIYTVTVTDAKGCSASSSTTIIQPAPLSASLASFSNVTCFGMCNGTAMVTAAGGTTPYSYAWSPGGQASAAVNNMCAGTHTVTVTDAKGCMTSLTVIITQPQALDAVVTGSNITCYNACTGTASVVTTGGIGPYTFLWSPGFQASPSLTGLCVGTYSVTVTDSSGCLVKKQIAITQPTPVTLTTTVTGTACGNSTGTACVNISGGTPPFVYQWNDPANQATACASQLAANSYTVTVTDGNNCIHQVTASVNNTNGPTISISSSTPLTCNGSANGTATAAMSGGTPPYTLLWLPSGQTTAFASGLNAGIHTVTVKDAIGCMASASVTITQPTLLGSAISSVTAVNCSGLCNGSAEVISGGGTPPYTYSWNSIPAQTIALAIGLCAGGYTVTVSDAKGCTTSSAALVSQPTGISIATLSLKDVSCSGGNDGTIQVSVGGGTPGYTYLWAPSGGSGATASGLTAGTYTLTVTDTKNCVGTATYTIGQPMPLSSVLTSTPVSCNGGTDGTATITVADGTPGYAYQWLPAGGTGATATGLTAGTYSVYVTDTKGCRLISTAVISEPSLMMLTTSSSVVSCSGGSNGTATVSVSGGSPGYTYSWTTNPLQTTATATNLSAGVYTVTVTDAKGCKKTGSVTVNQNTSLTVTASASGVSCSGGSDGTVSVNAVGGVSGYMYVWTPGNYTSPFVNSLPAGTYSVTVTDALGCTGVSSAVVTQPSTITVTATVITPVSCKGGSNATVSGNATGGTPGYFYVWTPAGGTQPTASGLTAGTYTLTVIDSKNCSSSVSVGVTEPPVLAATTTVSNVSCNGSKDGSATVTASGGNATYAYAWSPSGGNNPTATGLSAGNYTVTITDAKGCTHSSPVNIQQPTPLVITSSSTIIRCYGGNNGSATISASGGTPGYSYVWATSPIQTTPTAVNLIAGLYSYTVTDANGCQVSNKQEVKENSKMMATATSSSVACKGGSTGTVSVTGSGGTPGYAYYWLPGGYSSSTVNALASGTYTVVITDALGCTATATTTIAEPPALNAAVTLTGNISCNGGRNGTLSGSASGGTPGYFYQWFPSGGTLPIASNLKSGTYTLTVTDSKNCQDSKAITLQEPAALSVAVSETPVSCFGGSNGAASVVATGGTPGYSYSWSSGGTGPSVTGLSAGTHTVAITDQNNCSLSQTFTIQQPSKFVAAITANTNLSCFGICNGIAQGSATGGTMPYSYTWLPVNVSSPSINNLCAGTYTLMTVDANNCQSTSTITIAQPSAITATITSIDNNCFKSCDGTAGIVVKGGVGPYTFNWKPDLETTPFITGKCAGTYTVAVKDNNNCLSNTMVVIGEPSVLTGNVSIMPATCGNANGTVTVVMSGGTPPYAYQWNDPAFQTSATATNLAAGNYHVNVTDAHGCVFSSTVTVPGTINPIITSISANPPVCFGTATGSATVYVSGGTPGYTYQWNDPSNQTNSTVTGLLAGKYTVVVTDALGCKANRSITLTQPTRIKTTISANDSSLCYGQSVQLFCSATGGNPGYKYIWNTGYTGPGPITYAPTHSTIYSVYTEDSSGCQSVPASVVITVSPPISVIADDVATCSGTPVIISAKAFGGHSKQYTYLWSNGYVGAIQTVSVLLSNSPETFIVTVSDGCSNLAYDTVIVTVNPLATASLTLSDTSGCEPLRVKFNATSDIGTTFTWMFGDGTPFITGASVSHTYVSAGIYLPALTVSTGAGCITSVKSLQPVHVYASPVAEFRVSPSVTPLPNATTVHFTNLSSGATAYLWDFGDSTRSSLQNPQHYYALTGNYELTLIAMNAAGCADTFSLQTTSETYIHFANAFTPNLTGGNGGSYSYNELNNDVFFPTSQGVDTYHLMIYNKWGELLFESFDIRIGWDGYYKGKLCEQDVYVWKAFATFIDGTKFSGVGDVTLLR